MPIRQYPFFKLSENTPDIPLLYIKITNPETGKTLNTISLVDTGASDCHIPGKAAPILGINLESSDKSKSLTGGGNTTVYLHNCIIDIYDTREYWNKNLKIVYTIQKSKMVFVPNLHITCLGVMNFLDQFVLNIDYPNKVFSIYTPET